MMKNSIPSKYENAIKHAIATFNKPLLNRLELELIRIFEIKPFDERCHDHKNLSPIGIAEVGGQLLIKWGNSCCPECNGTGTIEATGKTMTFDVDCPSCMYGSSEGESIITDIDGKSINFDGNEANFETFYVNCPLAKYNDEQRKLKASRVAA